MSSEQKPIALFLFAHQDDEFGVFQAILDEIAQGHCVHCAYLTDGSYGGASPQQRNQESLDVLAQLGVAKKNITFAGDDLNVRDAFLHEQLETCAAWIQKWMTSFDDIAAVYVSAWEGGHHDHDVLHAVTISIADNLNLLHLVRQFSLYNSHGCPGQLFKVFNPLTQNGKVISRTISASNRFKFLRYCLSYPSQRKAWLGLFPFVMLHYVSNGTQQLQPVSLERINERPHEGDLYYEKRKFFTWGQMKECIARVRFEKQDFS